MQHNGVAFLEELIRLVADDGFAFVGADGKGRFAHFVDRPCGDQLRISMRRSGALIGAKPSGA